ncbi:hypothetical protein COOONC_24193 [Cooperia oncophora]
MFSDRCPTYTAMEEWYSGFNLGLNSKLEWDAGLSSDACNEARGIVPSNAPHKFKAEKYDNGNPLRDGLKGQNTNRECTQSSCTHQIWMQQLLRREPSKSRLCLQVMME